jgi:hypothetical protein
MPLNISQARRQQIIDETLVNIEEIRYRRFVEDAIMQCEDNKTSLDEVKNALLNVAKIKQP